MNEKYDAFISYAHSADEMLAPKLQQGLQVFAKPWNKRRALRVFRDEASLSANPDLWSSIETALLGSRWLILLASQPSASSPWVEKEVAAWCQYKAPENILVALTDGDIRWNNATGTFDPNTTSSLPSAARLAMRVEPRVVDLRWTRGEQPAALTLRDQRFAAAVADLAAPLHNVPKDELIGEDRRQHLKLVRWRRATFSGLAVLTVLSLIATFFAIGQRNQARDRADIAQSRQLAAQSADLLQDSPALSALLAVEAYRKSSTQEAYRAVLDAAGRPYLETVLHGEPIAGSGFAISPYETSAAYSRDGKLAAASGVRGDITVWDVATGRPVLSVSASTFNAQLALNGERLIVYDPGLSYSTWDIPKGTMLSQWTNPPEGTMSADGATILANPPETNILEIWNATNRTSGRLTFNSEIAAFGLRSDGAEIAAISAGRLLFVDNAGKSLGSVAAPATIGARALTLSDDGRTVVAYSEEGRTATRDPLTITLIDRATGTTNAIKTDLSDFTMGRFGAGGTTLALSDISAVQLVDVKGKRTSSDAIPMRDGLSGMAFDPTSSKLMLSSRSGEAYVFNVAARQTLATPLATKGAIAAATPDRSRLAVLTERAVVVLDGATGNPVGTTIAIDAPDKDGLRALALSPTGGALAVLSGDQLSVYDTKSGARVGSRVRVECGYSSALTLDERGARVLHAPRVVTVIDVRDGRVRDQPPCPSRPPDSAYVDSTGRYAVFTVDVDDTRSQLTWWDSERDRTVDELALRGDGPYIQPTVSPGGRFVVTGMIVRLAMRVFDLQSKSPVFGVIDELTVLNATAFSDDGATVAWASQSTFTLYDLEQRRSLGSIANLPGDFSGAAIGPGGTTAFATSYKTDAASASPLVKIDLRPQSLVDVACAMANRNLTDEEQLFYLGSVTSRKTCPQLPREPRSLRQRTDIPVVSAALVTTTTPVATTRSATTASTSRVTTISTTTRPPTTSSTTRTAATTTRR